MIAYPNYGFGNTGSTIVSSVGGVTQTVGLSLAKAGLIAGPAGAIVSAVGALVALAGTIAGALHIGEGCGQTCIQATQIVNQAEPLLQQNLAAYENGQLDQATALNNFDQVWGAVQTACKQIPGAAGSNCVSDRQAGSCKWKGSDGQCWNWFVGYRDPLTKPSNVPYVGATVGGVDLTSLFSGSTSTMLLVGGGLALVGLLMVGD